MKIATSFLLLFLACHADRATKHDANREVEFNSRRVLEQDFNDESYWPATGGAHTVEFCGGDWCQEVSFPDPAERQHAWDAVFILFYFLDANENFRNHREPVARHLLEEHGEHCPAEQLKRAACALERLQEKYGLKYHRVQYDIGYRCSSLLEAKPPHFTDHGECVKYEE